MTAVVEETKVSDSLLFWDVTLTVTDHPYCTPDHLWKASAWRHGCQANHIPSLLKIDGSRQLISDKSCQTGFSPCPETYPSFPPR